MLVRIWLVLLALLMVAAPAADVAAETADAVSYEAAEEDGTATAATAVTLDECPARVVDLPSAAETTRPAPALARVFRPPRPAFD